MGLVVITLIVQVAQQKFAVMRHLLVGITQLTEQSREMIITMLVQEHMAINSLSLEKALKLSLFHRNEVQAKENLSHGQIRHQQLEPMTLKKEKEPPNHEFQKQS